MPAKTWLHRHSLSLCLLALTLGLGGAAAACEQGGRWYDLLGGMRDGSWGAWLIVVATKYFMEAGSPQSK